MVEARYDQNGRRQYQHADRKIRVVIRARGDECGICGGEINYTAQQYEPDAFEVDHLVPISHGGTKTLENSRATHRRCNRLRSNTIDADAIAAGAQPVPHHGTSARRRQRPFNDESELPKGCSYGPCQPCQQIHDPRPGVHYVTLREWKP